MCNVPCFYFSIVNSGRGNDSRELPKKKSKTPLFPGVVVTNDWRITYITYASLFLLIHYYNLSFCTVGPVYKQLFTVLSFCHLLETRTTSRREKNSSFLPPPVELLLESDFLFSSSSLLCQL